MSLSPETVLAHVLRPIVRFALARGIRFQAFSDILRSAYVEAAHKSAGPGEKPPTVSRIALLTGLQRRDVKERMETPPRLHGPGLVARIMATWPRDREILDRVAFDALVQGLNRDMHPRTALDEMNRLGLVHVAPGGIELLSRSLVLPENDGILLGYLAANLGDHATAAVENVLAAPEPGPHLERAVHYNMLSEKSADEIEAQARRGAEKLLEELNALSSKRQNTGKGRTRMRFGVYFYREESS